MYGLIITGAVLATAPEEFRLVRVAILLVGTLAIYWAAETYVHWISARAIRRRDLSRHERWQLVRDGWPLMTAAGVPLAFLGLEALFRIETATALQLTLAINAVLLFIVGWDMSRSVGLTGARLLGSAVITGLLGVAMIVLKTLLH